MIRKTILFLGIMVAAIPSGAFTITGTIATSKGTPVGGVTVTLSLQVTYRGVKQTGTETVTTNSSGVYTYTQPTPLPSKGDGFSVRITPSKSGYTFSPTYSDAGFLPLTSLLTRNFTANTSTRYTITATAGTRCSISPSGSISVLSGASQTFTVSVEAGYIEVLVIDGTEVPFTNSYTFSNVQGNHTIHVYAGALKNHICRCLSGPGGTTNPSGDILVPHGMSGTVQIIPDAGYRVNYVTLDGISIGSNTSYTFTNVTQDHTLYAYFTLKTYTLNASAGTGGTISPAGTASVTHGGSQSYTITPSSCYQVANVVVDGSSLGARTSYTFSNVTANHSISATFSRTSQTVRVTQASGGTISPAGNVSVPCGGSQTFTITPATSCHTVASVTVNGSVISARTSYTFSNVTSTQSITAAFGLKNQVITAAAGTGGSISPAGNVSVACGYGKSFTISPSACYDIADVLVNGSSVGPVSSYAFSNVTTDQAIHASFRQKQFTLISSAGPGGAISPAGTLAAACGTEAVFAVIPDTGCIITDVVLDGISRGAVDTVRIPDVRAEHTVAASFAPFTGISANRMPNHMPEILLAPLPPAAGQAITVSVRYAGAGEWRIIARRLDGSVAAVLFDGISPGGSINISWQPAGAGIHSLEISGPGFCRSCLIPVIQ